MTACNNAASRRMARAVADGETLGLTDLSEWERGYVQLLAHVALDGEVFAPQPIEVDLDECFPAALTRRLDFREVSVDLCWRLRGLTTLDYLHEHDVHAWDELADDGELGPIYGEQWRGWLAASRTLKIQLHDQLARVIAALRSRDPGPHILSAWNVGELDEMAAPPRHICAQFVARPLGRLDCQVYVARADVYEELPHDVALYALLTHLLARETGLHASRVVVTLGEVSLGKEHQAAALEQLEYVAGGLGWRPLPHLDDIPRRVQLLDPNAETMVSPEHLHLIDYRPCR